MDPDERNMEEENTNDAPGGARGGGGDDDDFGEFEGFEGGIEHLQALPAPSPWATFPDLLPVQTSPATPADEGQPSRNNNSVNREVWHPVAAIPWGGPSNMDDHRPAAQPARTLNPPDVSLGTNQGAGGRVTPDNVHDAELAEVVNNVAGGMGLDARLPVAQLDLLQQQLGDAEQSRAVLEEQVDQLRQRNVELEVEVANSQAQINELSSRLQQNQAVLEQRLLEIRNINNGDVRRDLQQLQEEVRAIRSTQTSEQSDLASSLQQIEQMKVEISNKFQSLESNIQREYVELEQRLLSRFGEECLQMRSAIEMIVQQSVQQFSGTFSQIVMDTLQKSTDSCQGSDLMQQIRVELERHEEQQRKALEEERRRQLNTVSSALQSALQHLSGAMNNTPKKGGGEKS